jgi:hypothetical protein
MSDAAAVVKNASDPKQVNAAGSKVKQRERAALDRIKTVMSTRDGRRYLWDLMDTCHVFESTFTSDPYRTAYSEGARLIGLKVLAQVNTLPAETYLLMVNEAKEDLERGL